MSTQVVGQGTVRPDGGLDLDAPLPLPPGRVQIIVQPLEPTPLDDPFWQMMEGIWAGQKARCHIPRSAEQVEAERRALREGMEAEIQEAIRLHQQCRQARRGNKEDEERRP
jgi:hypothetical protein